MGEGLRPGSSARSAAGGLVSPPIARRRSSHHCDRPPCSRPTPAAGSSVRGHSASSSGTSGGCGGQEGRRGAVMHGNWQRRRRRRQQRRRRSPYRPLRGGPLQSGIADAQQAIPPRATPPPQRLRSGTLCAGGARSMVRVSDVMQWVCRLLTAARRHQRLWGWAGAPALGGGGSRAVCCTAARLQRACVKICGMQPV